MNSATKNQTDRERDVSASSLTDKSEPFKPSVNLSNDEDKKESILFKQITGLNKQDQNKDDNNLYLDIIKFIADEIKEEKDLLKLEIVQLKDMIN